MVRLGFSRAYGTGLNKTIAGGTKNRFTAFFSGAFVTALLQSSTATALLLISFAKKHRIALPTSLAVVIGADLSTTLVAQVLSFDLSWLSPALLMIGIITHMIYEQSGRKRHIARIFIGLGLMLLALSLIREASAPLQNSETLPLILAPLINDPVLAIALAAILTWIMHSSLASVLLFASLATSGIINLQLGILLVLGANLGGAFVPFVATLHDGGEARRITFGNISMRMVMIILAAPFLSEAAIHLSDLAPETPRQILHFHTGFNIALALIFLPFVSIVAWICEKLVPLDRQKPSKSDPLYLDEEALKSPVMALAGAARETLRIAETIEEIFIQSLEAFEKGDEKLIKKIRKADHDIDGLNRAIKLYMTRVSQEGLDPKEADRYLQILTFSTNLEHIGDIIDKSLMDMAEKKRSKSKEFSKEGFAEIKSFHNQVLQNMRMAQAIFMSEDPKLAAHLVAGKEQIREAAKDSAEQHFKRLQSGLPETIATSAIHLDIIRDYRRINSYVTRVAFTIVENAKKYEDQRQD